MTIAPTPDQRSLTPLMWLVPVVASGVSITRWSTNKSAVAAVTPDFSEPAMGWPGTSWMGMLPYMSMAALMTLPFTLATSVRLTSLESNRWQSLSTVGTVNVGTPITTRSPAPNSGAMASRLGSTRSIIPRLSASSRVESRLEIPTTCLARPFSRAARAKLEPIRPKPITTIRLKTGGLRRVVEGCDCFDI